MSSVGVGKPTALGIEDAIEAGDKHVGWDVGKERLVDSLSTSPAMRGQVWAASRSMPQVVDITSAAGTPLPVASPTTSPSRPSESRWKS